MLKFIHKGIDILSRRVRSQGLRVTLIWMYGRGIPKLTGIPLMQFSQVTPNLYVGPQYGKQGRRALEAAGIHHGVNMRVEFDDAVNGLALVNYCHVPVVDDDAPTIEQLWQGVQFIQDAIAQDGKVYIHCAGGIGRAPTMAAAYLISQGMTLDHAVQTIQKARPFIQIMPVQMQQLKVFESIQERQHDARV